MSIPTFFNAHHSPIGAFASFTFGSKGASGGLGVELKGPANENLYVGAEEMDHPGHYRALPFYDETSWSGGQESDFDVEGLSGFKPGQAISSYADSDIQRKLGIGVDEWSAGDLTLSVYSPMIPVPDPQTADIEAMKAALAPAVIVEITLDNRRGRSPRKVFFGYAGSDRHSAMRSWSSDSGSGVGQGQGTAIGTVEPDVYAGVAWQPDVILEPKHSSNLNFLLGSIGLLVGSVAAGQVRTFRFSVAFFREGTATNGLPSRYLYRRWFESIEDVLSYSLCNADRSIEAARANDLALPHTLSEERRVMIAQAIRSYYGSTQCLELRDGRPFWVVNEGEYRMMNTFDLTVDQAFFELALNPWTVRNELDMFVQRYSYVDRVRFPGESKTYPGGIAFTHDMGIGNALSDPGYSGYEQAGLTGCFSYMSCEELVNWVLCACVYAHQTGDFSWVRSNGTVFGDCLRSLEARDHPEPHLRNGLMGLDSDRCDGGFEITTYDSLDASLGQARNNLYLGVKTWAAYVLLEPLLRRLGDEDLAERALDQATRSAASVVGAADEQGLLPAILGEGVDARIIPAIEGLVYPLIGGRSDALAEDGPYGKFRSVLETHFGQILRPGICVFEDGGWKLSSTSRNSWLSKIYLCQFVSEEIFGHEPDHLADQAHMGWLMDEANSYYAWSDQMLAGKVVGSRYYPRGVTSILWLAKDGKNPIDQIREVLLGRNQTLETVS